MQPDDSSISWFALRVRSRREQLVTACLRGKGFEGFLPLYTVRRKWSDRFVSQQTPLFPGYVFCRLDPRRRLPVLTIPGVCGLVGVGKTPVSIPDVEIAALQTVIHADVGREPWPRLEPGQRVRIEYGPLADLEGVLVEVRGARRLILSVSLLRRAVAVEIERDWVCPVAPTRRAPPPLVGRQVSLRLA